MYVYVNVDSPRYYIDFVRVAASTNKSARFCSYIGKCSIISLKSEWQRKNNTRLYKGTHGIL